MFFSLSSAAYHLLVVQTSLGIHYICVIQGSSVNLYDKLIFSFANSEKQCAVSVASARLKCFNVLELLYVKQLLILFG